jgi:serine protease
MRTPLLTLAFACASLLAPWSMNTHAQSAVSAGQARVIVKYKPDSALGRMQALSAAAPHTERAQALGQRMGLAMRAGAEVAERTQVVFASGMTSEQLAQRLSGDSDIEYAVPDQRRHRLAAPSDPLYAGGATVSPVSGQWYLRAPAGEVRSSIDVETAWNFTTGSPSIVVAVLDTGIRFDHPDLKTVAAGGNLLPGYDMIVDTDVSNDGGGRDADPSDPGDWLTSAEVNQVGGPFAGCGNAADSSWHGTQTAGLIGALTNNGVGMASVGRTVRVLPVRVLGKCGGFDSDIVAGMRWAAGLSVPGVPANPNPAKVINMSLGGDGACSTLYQDAVTAINAAGTVIVASAGNSSGHAVSTPANCNGVIAVAGLRHLGTKVGFSDLGSQISISAPGGNCVNTVGACLYPIATTSNAGTTTPVTTANGSIYTDANNISVGTSFSAPLVAGAAALMLSANPALTPAQVRTTMRSTARAFPTTGAGPGTPQCVAPAAIGQPQTDQGECYCTTTTCGAGMLDAGAAVTAAAATASVQARVGLTPSAPQAGQTVTFSAAGSTVPAGRSIASYLWVLTNGGGIVSSFIGATDGATASATPTAAGSFSVSLTVTDSTGAQATSSSTVTVTAVPVVTPAPPEASAPESGGGGGAVGAGWLTLLGLAVLLLGIPAGRRRRA